MPTCRAHQSTNLLNKPMKPLDYPWGYGRPIFPCVESGPHRKKPYTKNGYLDATCDPDSIYRWWQEHPNALAGMPTGRVSGCWVLDIDNKPGANGFETLHNLGIVLPRTPVVHTPSGGQHLYFDAGEKELRNSTRLIGPGVDVRGDGGYVIVPTDGSGYVWDPFDHPCVPLAPAPDWLWPPKKECKRSTCQPVVGLSPYAEGAINRACEAIFNAPPGFQEATLNGESYSLGTLVGAGACPYQVAFKALLKAGRLIPDYDPKQPWRPEQIEFKVKRAFEQGIAHPRGADCGVD